MSRDTDDLVINDDRHTWIFVTKRLQVSLD